MKTYMDQPHPPKKKPIFEFPQMNYGKFFEPTAYNNEMIFEALQKNYETINLQRQMIV